MISKEDESLGNPLVNTEKLEEVISIYKFPFILGIIGVLFLVIAVGMMVKNLNTSQDVVFTTSATSSAQAKIHIDVQGAIMSPGVYTLAEGSRVGDALTVSGGLAAGADRQWIAKNLNRAAKLIDGGKIYIPSIVETASGKSDTQTGGQNQISENNLSNSTNLLGVTTNMMNINSASQAELEALPGIGPVTANKIIAGRPYQTVEELKNRKIIGQSLYNKIKDSLTI